MKLFFRNIIVAVGILFSTQANAQVADSVRLPSAKDLIELENNKNLTPTTKNNPRVVAKELSAVAKPPATPVKAKSKFRKRKNR